MDGEGAYVTGTLVWYYFVCHRQVWLMTHQVNPDEDDANMDLGRFIHETSYPRRNQKEILIGHVKLDIMRFEDGVPVVGEVKKSSKYLGSARMQLAFYLLELRRRGIEARGELLIPKEKKVISVELNDEVTAQLIETENAIRALAVAEVPPPAHRIGLCASCAYQELCWS